MKKDSLKIYLINAINMLILTNETFGHTHEEALYMALNDIGMTEVEYNKICR